GVVTQERNYPLLRQNGRIFFIDRPLSELSKKGRPISQARPIEDIAAERMPAYISWSDERIPMETSAKAAEIIRKRCGL
ncbi:MAG: shikimate kinase, partial [Firmicutes bacterium]|nr:shikimate kinase [Bacillota bacterium]